MLARKAEALNEDNKFLPIWIVLWFANIAALFIEEFLPYGIVAAAWLVYSGIVSYVAYKDIFERRPVNLIEPASDTAVELPSTRTAPAEAECHPWHLPGPAAAVLNGAIQGRGHWANRYGS